MLATEPPLFTRVAFPVKALKLLLHELQPSGEASLAAPQAPLAADFDDGVSYSLPVMTYCSPPPKRILTGLMRRG